MSDPVTADSLHQQALDAHAAGRLQEAASLLVQALNVDSARHATRVQLGVIHILLGQHAAAEQVLRAAVTESPHDAFAHYNLGNALYFQGQWASARQCFELAVALDDSLADAHHNLGFVQAQQGDLHRARDSFQRAVDRAPKAANSWFSLGNTYRELGRTDSALACYDRALQIDPRHAQAHLNRGTVLQGLRRLEEALHSFDAAWRHDPHLDFVTGTVLFTRLRLARWERLDDLVQITTQLTAQGKAGCHPFTLQVVCDSPALQLQAARTWMGRQHPGHEQPKSLTLPPAEPGRERRIRVGYFSSDFYDHPVSRLMVEVFERHDRARFEVLGFGLGGLQDGFAQRVRSAFDRFFDVSTLPDHAVVDLVRQEGVDIAIDLNGHTMGSRTGIFARRAAPLQLSYIGYLGTMGSPCYDYLVADESLTPAGREADYTEKILRLPIYQANPSAREIQHPPPTRFQLGLPREGVVFCAANNTYKILPKVFASWGRILEQVPGSVLYLIAETTVAADFLRDNAPALGVDIQRVFVGGRVAYAEYMARLQVPDLLLDTFPYTAGTTASDALWAGLPVLTRRGESFASRMAASVLTAAGLEELITDSIEAYEATAVALGRDPPRLASLRQKLHRHGASPSALFDTARFVRSLESALDRVFERGLQGLAPQHITVTSAEADEIGVAVDTANRLLSAIADHQAGRVEQAESVYLAVLRRDPSHADASHLLGVALHQRGDLQGGQRWIERAIELAPAEPLYVNNLAQLHEQQGRLDQALACLDSALARHPTQEQWQVRREAILRRMGQ